MRILAFAASLRKGSWNRRLLELGASIAREAGAGLDVAEFREFEMPMYDADLDREQGLPPGGLELARRLKAADALLIAVPEYNYSIPGTFKNAIDWVSRVRPMPWRGKSVYLMSAAPSPMGGIRGLWQTRIPLEGCGAIVFPDMFALAHADKAFAADGRLNDAALMERLRKEIAGFVRVAEALAPLCGGHATAPAPVRKQVAEALENESALQPEPGRR
jgi:chromate reductase, NAD(P)H dehydrogenase (quinone)